MLLGTETLDLQIAWPTGLTGTATMPVQCYEAFIDEDSGTFYVGSDSTPLAVFGGTTSASVTFSNSNPPTSLRGSVDVNLDSQSGNFFFIGAGTSVSSGANTYLFRGGTILTKP